MYLIKYLSNKLQDFGVTYVLITTIVIRMECFLLRLHFLQVPLISLSNIYLRIVIYKYS